MTVPVTKIDWSMRRLYTTAYIRFLVQNDIKLAALKSQEISKQFVNDCDLGELFVGTASMSWKDQNMVFRVLHETKSDVRL